MNLLNRNKEYLILSGDKSGKLYDKWLNVNIILFVLLVVWTFFLNAADDLTEKSIEKPPENSVEKTTFFQ